jgi:hypothetical protein
MLSDGQAATLGDDQVASLGVGAGPSHALACHLVRGAIGFGLIGCALVLTTSVGPASLLLLAPGMVALRGCPTCWIVGLIETVSAGRLERTCTDAGCTLSRNQHGPFE